MKIESLTGEEELFSQKISKPRSYQVYVVVDGPDSYSCYLPPRDLGEVICISSEEKGDILYPNYNCTTLQQQSQVRTTHVSSLVGSFF